VQRIVAMLVALIAMGASAGTGADEHLLAGARRFRAGQFAEALVEFRVAEKLGKSDEAAWYRAACLVRLNRSEEAVEAFADASRRAPRVRDDLFDYYHAVACHDARLYLCADKLLAGVGNRAGPRIRDEAQKLRTRIGSVLRNEPTKTAIDWYHVRAAQASQRGRPLLAHAFLEEAAGLSARRKDRYRPDDGEVALLRARQGERRSKK
jgi:tetratricopeptide (TPR) repeat protein